MTSAIQPQSENSTERPELERQLAELQATLAAIGAGGVDAVVVQGTSGSDVYTHATADKPYRVILEEMGDAAITLSGLGLILYANRRFCELTDLDRSDVLGHDVKTLVAPADHLLVSEILMLPTGQTRHVQLQLGQGPVRRTVQVAATGIDQGGMPLTCAILTDVTDRHRNEMLLAEAVDRFSAVFDQAPLGMALLDRSGRVLRCNSALTELLGYPPKGVVESEFAAMFHGQSRSGLREDLADLFGGRRSMLHREVRLSRTDGRSGWASVSASVVRAESGDQAVLHVQDISESKQYEQRLEVLAERDTLTGLYNRRRFREELERWLRSLARHGTAGAVLLFDLDNFKYVNDTLGHATGDRLLQKVGVALSERVRSTDIIGRLGGDEFGCILPAVGRQDAIRVADNYLAMLRGAEFIEGGVRLRVSASAGMVLVDVEDARSAEEILADADVAMYEAKEQGRDAVVVFDPSSLQVKSWRERFHALDMVQRALDEDTFTLYAQPIMNVSSGEVDGYELLVRMLNGRQVIGPDKFLDVAERHGLGPAIDKWVVRNALGAIAASAHRAKELRWEINLSAGSLSDDSLLEEIEWSVATTPVPPSAVVFEITETAAIANLLQAQRFVEQVTQLGCRFAMDDFGAGYGSFYYLKHLPFDFLKIDGEFVRELAREPRDQMIVASIVTAARGMGKDTIAEYVQDAESLTILRELGVGHAQGFHIGHPRPLAEVLGD